MGLTPAKEQEQKFTLVKRAMSFTHAWRGIVIFLKTTYNAWMHVAIFVAVVALGLYVHINRFEWILLILASGIVFATEAFNTAIEIDIDLTSPEYHPMARDTKDVAAGAVLIAAASAFVVGLFIFVPYIL